MSKSTSFRPLEQDWEIPRQIRTAKTRKEGVPGLKEAVYWNRSAKSEGSTFRLPLPKAVNCLHANIDLVKKNVYST